MEKMFRSLDEQIEILKSRGLIIEDENLAKEILISLLMVIEFCL